jgi:iron complex outermembrane recepter protein
MRSLLGATRGLWLSAIGCGVLFYAAQAVAQVTSPSLQEGSAYAIARPRDLAEDVSAVAVVEVLIASDGSVSSAQVVDVTVSDPAFTARVRDAVIEHARGLHFHAALRDGVPVAVRTHVRLQLGAAAGLSTNPYSARPTSAADYPSNPYAAPTAGSVAPPGAPSVGAADTPSNPYAAPPAAAADYPSNPYAAQSSGAGQPPTAASAPTAAAAGGAASAVSTQGAASAPTAAAAGGAASAVSTQGAASAAGDSGVVRQPTAASKPEYGARAKLHTGVGPVRPVAASDMDIEPGALSQVPRLDAQSYLTLSPGIVLSNHSGIGHVSSVFMRGFDAGEGQDLEVRVDDVPINEPSNAHEHGYADTAFVIPETVERLRVQQGTFDPRQGDFAVAGSVSYALGVKQRGLRAQFGLGSFNEQRGLLLWAPTNTSKGTFTALDVRRGDGFGPQRSHQSASLLARYAGAAGPLHYSLLLGSHVQQFDSAGVVRQDAVDARALPCAKDERSQFFCAQDPAQGGSGQRQLLRGSLVWAKLGRRYELMAYGMLRGLRIRENFTGARIDTRGDGQDEGYDTGSAGLQSSYVLTPTLRGFKQRFELGVSARHDAGETRMWRLRSNTAVPYATVFDRDLSLTHIAGYLRAELIPLSWLSLRGGVRLDNFGFSTEDLAAPDSDRVGARLPRDARAAWGTAVSPRAALVLAPWPGFTWSFSAGQGVRSSDAQALSEGERAPFARVLALETGPAWSHNRGPLRLTTHGFMFATRVSDDLLFDPVRGRNVPIGPSNRYGFALSARAQVGRHHDTMASFTWTDARAIEPSQGIFALATGDTLAYVPRSVLRIDHVSGGELDIQKEHVHWSIAGGLGWVGPMPMPLGAASYARWQLDASARVRVRAFELGLSAINLFDIQNRALELYYTSSFGADGAASMRAARHFAAGAPRSFWLTLTIFLDDLELV